MLRIHVVDGYEYTWGEVQAKGIGRSGLLFHGGVKRKMRVSKDVGSNIWRPVFLEQHYFAFSKSACSGLVQDDHKDIHTVIER
ncbi:hypothetical protein D5086_000935 [Populus alba]|uniref:Uncharacterized protein n=1 Tax=Populus alba TaxID=43335 RepID=A0ACC4CYV5_POPAL